MAILRKFLRIIKWGFISFLALFVLLLAVLQFWGFDQITRYTPEIEQELGQLLNSRVKLEKIRLSWDYFRPRVDVQGLSIYRHGETLPALSLKDAYAILAWRSVWLGTPILAHAQLDSPYIEIRRQKDGELYLAGYHIDMQKKGDGSGARIFLSQPSIAITQAQVRWQDETVGGLPLSLAHTDIKINSGYLSHRFDVSTHLNVAPAEKVESVLALKVQADMAHPAFTADISDVSTWRGIVRVQLPQLELARVDDVMAALAGYLPPVLKELQPQLKPLSGHVGFEASAWIDQLHLSKMNGALHLADLRIPLPRNPALVPNQPYHLKAFNTQFAYQSPAPEQFAVQLKAIELETPAGVRFTPSDVQIERSSPTHTKFTLADMAFAPVLALLKNLPLVSKYAQPLHALSVSGGVKGVVAEIDGKAYRVAAQLENMNASASEQAGIVPVVSGLNAHINGSDQGGQLVLKAAKLGAIAPKLLAAQTSVIENLGLQLAWQHEAAAWQVAIKQFDFDQGPLEVRGKGSYHWQSKESDRLRMNLAINQLALGEIYRFLPYSITGARKWLGAAFGRGELKDITVQVDTSLQHFVLPDGPTSGPPVLQLNGRIETAQVNYLPNVPVPHKGATLWPTLQVASAQVNMTNRHLTITSTEADTSGIAVDALNFQIPDLTAPVILVDAHGMGPLADLIDYVNKSPVGGLIGNLTTDTVAKGISGLNLQLRLPLVGSDPLAVSGRLAFNGNSVQLMPSTPVVSKIEGAVGFSLKGASSEGLDFELLGGAHHYVFTADEAGVMSLNGQGQVVMAEVEKLAPTLPLWRGVSGQLPYQVKARIAGSQIEAALESSTEGLGLSLPLPFRKTVAQREPLRLSVSKNEQLKASLTWLGAEGLALTLGAQGLSAQKPLGQGLEGQLSLGRFDWNEWEKFLVSPTPAKETRPPAPFDAALLIPNAKLPIKDFHLKVGATRLSYMDLGTVDLGLRNDIEKAAWYFSLNSKVAQGQGTWWAAPLIASSRAQLKFDFIRIPAPPPEPLDPNDKAAKEKAAKDKTAKKPAAKTEAKKPIPMPALPVLELEVADLNLLDRPLGSLRVVGGDPRAQPQDQAVAWQLKQADLKSPLSSLQLTGGWTEQKTEFAHTLHVANLGEWLSQLKFDKLLGEGTGSSKGQLSWAGTPTEFAFNRLDGQASVVLKDGSIKAVSLPAWRYLSVLSLQSYRNLGDAFSKDPTYQTIEAAVVINKGQLTTQHVDIVSFFANATGQAKVDFVDSTLNARVRIKPKVDWGGAAIFYGLLINPVVTIPLFLASWLTYPFIQDLVPELYIYGPFDDVKFETTKPSK